MSLLRKNVDGFQDAYIMMDPLLDSSHELIRLALSWLLGKGECGLLFSWRMGVRCVG